MAGMNSPLFVLHAAYEFLQTGSGYAAKHFKIKNDQELKFDSMIHPKLCVPVANIAMSLELSLKGILKVQGDAFKTHDLVKLFNCVSKSNQSLISEHFKSHDHYKKLICVRLIQGDGSMHGMKTQTTLPFEESIDKIGYILEVHKNAFIDFRYLFEFSGEKPVYIFFREFSNLAFSVLSVLGQLINVPVVINKKTEIS